MSKFTAASLWTQTASPQNPADTTGDIYSRWTSAGAAPIRDDAARLFQQGGWKAYERTDSFTLGDGTVATYEAVEREPLTKAYPALLIVARREERHIVFLTGVAQLRDALDALGISLGEAAA